MNDPHPLLHATDVVVVVVVLVVSGLSGTFPLYRQGAISEERVEEERRLCYVGITRAKSLLYMSWRQATTLNGRRDLGLQPMQPSRFLLAVPPDCCKVLTYSIFKGGLEQVPSAEWMASFSNKSSSPKPPRPKFWKKGGSPSSSKDGADTKSSKSGGSTGGDKSWSGSSGKKGSYGGGGGKKSWWGTKKTSKTSAPTTRVIPGAKTQVFDAAFLAKLKAERAAKEAKEGG